MKYELWDVVMYGHGEPPMPFTKLESATEFGPIYKSFLKTIKEKPCVIIVNAHQPKIYESPDGGETVYERDFGDYEKRKRIK
jgi:hypothetical protein